MPALGIYRIARKKKRQVKLMLLSNVGDFPNKVLFGMISDQFIVTSFNHCEEFVPKEPSLKQYSTSIKLIGHSITKYPMRGAILPPI